MKKIIVLMVAVMLLSMTLVSAGFWDGVGDGLQFMLTGAVVGVQDGHEGDNSGTEVPPPVEETHEAEYVDNPQEEYDSSQSNNEYDDYQDKYDDYQYDDQQNNYDDYRYDDYQESSDEINNDGYYECPDEQQGLDEQDRCYRDGGNPRWEYDNNGCSYVTCDFDNYRNDYNENEYYDDGYYEDDQDWPVCGDGICEEGEDFCRDDCGDQRNYDDRRSDSQEDTRCETKIQECLESCLDDTDECVYACEDDYDDCTGYGTRAPEDRRNVKSAPRFGAPGEGGDGYGSHNEYFDGGSCPDEEHIVEIEAGCQEHGGTPFIRNDHHKGCAFVECSFGGQGGGFLGGENICQSEDEANEIVAACEAFGQEAWTVPGGPGCEPRIVCKPPENARGYGMGHEEYQRAKDNFEDLDSTKLLLLVTKFDSLKIQLIGLQDRMLEISNFYADREDTETASNYENAAEELQAVIDKIDEQKDTIAEAAASGTLDFDTIVRMKSELRYSVDELMTNVVGAVLGVEVAETVLTEEDLDCGNDDYCFEELFRTCTEGASFEPESGIVLTLAGADESDLCTISIDSDYGSGTCNVPDYQYAILEKETIEPYCDESLQEMFAMEDQAYEQYEDIADSYGAPSGYDDYYEDDYQYDDYQGAPGFGAPQGGPGYGAPSGYEDYRYDDEYREPGKGGPGYREDYGYDDGYGVPPPQDEFR